MIHIRYQDTHLWVRTS